MSIDASAADPIYRQMTAEEAYAFYGDSISCIYYSTSGYKNVTLSPSPNCNVYYYASSTTSSDKLLPSWVYSSSIPYVVYYANVSDYSQNPSYLGFDISPNVHFTDCNAVRICAATYWGGSGTSISSSAYSESFFDVFNGNTLRFTNTPYILQDGTYSRLGLQRSGGSAFRVLPVPVDYVSDTLGDVSLMRIGFNGGKTDGGEITLYLSAPLVNDSAVGGTGVVTGTTAPSSGDINVNVDVDLTETNSWLENIFDGISNIGSALGNAISRLFLPDEQDIINWKQTIVTILNDTFGGIPELEQSLKDAISSIFSASARQTVTFEGIKVPAAVGQPEAVIVPQQEVPLKPNGFDNLFSWVEMFINIVATIAIANTCFNQVKRVIVGEVVIDAD